MTIIISTKNINIKKLNFNKKVATFKEYIYIHKPFSAEKNSHRFQILRHFSVIKYYWPKQLKEKVNSGPQFKVSRA